MRIKQKQYENNASKNFHEINCESSSIYIIFIVLHTLVLKINEQGVLINSRVVGKIPEINKHPNVVP